MERKSENTRAGIIMSSTLRSARIWGRCIGIVRRTDNMSDRAKKWGAMIHVPAGVARNIRIAVEKMGDQRIIY